MAIIKPTPKEYIPSDASILVDGTDTETGNPPKIKGVTAQFDEKLANLNGSCARDSAESSFSSDLAVKTVDSAMPLQEHVARGSK
jgi:hypothetical protein